MGLRQKEDNKDSHRQDERHSGLELGKHSGLVSIAAAAVDSDRATFYIILSPYYLEKLVVGGR